MKSDIVPVLATGKRTMKNIYFYSPNFWIGYQPIPTTPLCLDSWTKNHAPQLHQQLNWSIIDVGQKTQDQLLWLLDTHDIDILCLGLYVWNSEHVMATVRDIKKNLNRELIIITGGPESQPNVNPQWMIDNPDIDFATYGQGEQAFVHALDHVINQKKLNVLESNNLAWRANDGSIKVGTYKWLNNKEISPYVESANLLKKMVKELDHPSAKLVMAYETSRGCMYKCSFCDWQSGLSHKVYHRTFDIEKEIDMLGQLGVYNIYLADANFGQHKQDKIVAETFVKLKKEKHYPFNIVGQNFSKLRKKEAFEIMEIFLEGGLLTYLKFSIQDVHATVLDQIDRPDVPWNEHRQFIERLRSKFPNYRGYSVELIFGLPGQTRQSWEQSLCELEDFDTLVLNPFLLFSNAPANYDQEYSARNQIVAKPIYSPYSSHMPTRAAHVVSTASYSWLDYVYFTLLSSLVTQQHPMRLIKPRRQLFDTIKQHDDLSKTLDHMSAIMLDIQANRSTFVETWHQISSEFLTKIVEQNPGIWSASWLAQFEKWKNCKGAWHTL